MTDRERVTSDEWIGRRGSVASRVAVSRLDLLVLGVLVIAVGSAAAELATHGSDTAGWGRWVRLGLALASLVAGAASWLRWSRDRRANIALIATSSTVWAVGQLCAFVLRDVVHRDLAPGPAEIGFGLFVVAAYASVGCRLARFSPIRRLGLVSDAALLTASCSYLAWELWIHDGVAGHATFDTFVLVGLPLAEIGLAALGLVIFLQERATTVGIAAVAFAAIAGADTVLAAHGGRPAGWWYLAAAGLWFTTFVLLALVPGRISRPFEEHNPRPSILRVAFVYVPATISPLFAIRTYIAHDRHAGAVSLGIAVAYVLALSVNQFVRSWEASSYANRLAGSLAELGDAETRLRLLLDDLPEAVVVLDRSGHVREANVLTSRLTNRRPDEVLGKHFIEFIAPQHLERAARLWSLVQSGGVPTVGRSTIDLSFAPPADPKLLVEVDVPRPVRDLDRVAITLRDVTRQRADAAAYERARERFRLAFHGAPIGMALLTIGDGRLLDVNASFAAMVGTTVGDLVGVSLRDLSHPDDLESTEWLFQAGVVALADASSGANAGDGAAQRRELRLRRDDGSIVWVRTSVSLLQDLGHDHLAIAHVEDVTEQRRSSEQLRWAATHDELTRLPNRARFTAELTERLTTAPVGTTAVLFIDLDNFKVINDSLGHAVGDQLLRGMTQRLRGVLRGRDMLSRFGGDEFIVMLSDCSPDLSPSTTAERLREEVSRPLSIDGVELFVTASIGIAVAASIETTASDLLRDADAAMYRAKARGRDCVEVFAPSVHDASVLALRTAGELRRAVTRNEIVPYFQPIVCLRTGVLEGFEVLARWRHPERGLLGADQFLPMAEETGLIADVGAAILRSSLVQLGRWRDKLPGFADVTMSVNVSARQLLGGDFAEVVSDALTEAGVPAGSLWLEITETALMTDVKAATVALRDLRGIGLHLAVDDFGTGYSSLTYLKRFPVESIKVDRSFVNGLGIDAEDSTIVEAVINLGHSLGLTVIGEGVETPLQLTRLRELGCDRAQGFLFGRPRPAEIIEAERSLAP